jgi:serine/threonine-protein kinase RsbW
MEWLLDPRRQGSGHAAVETLTDHLVRHAADTDKAQAATPELERHLDKHLSGAPTPVWIHLDWSASQPRFTVSALDEAQLADLAVERVEPVTVVPARHRARLRDARTQELAEFALPVARASVPDFDPDVQGIAGVDVDPGRDGPAAATVALAAAREAFPAAPPDQSATFAGVGLADAVAAEDRPTSREEAVRLVAETHAALGGDVEVIASEHDRVELAVQRCPFGDSIADAPSLCRITVGLAGRLAARVDGEATVVLDEAIAFGDPECRLQVVFGEADDAVQGNVFRWPGSETVAEEEHAPPRMDLTVSLPRETHSVPVVRRLAAQALRAFGVADDDVSDVELAITEACANVVDHALDSDAYEVRIELAADRCSITVIDRGGGFDATSIAHQDDDDAEHGRGITLMRALVDNVAFTNEPKVGAVVHMVKALDYDPEHPLHRRTH